LCELLSRERLCHSDCGKRLCRPNRDHPRGERSCGIRPSSAPRLQNQRRSRASCPNLCGVRPGRHGDDTREVPGRSRHLLAPRPDGSRGSQQRGRVILCGRPRPSLSRRIAPASKPRRSLSLHERPRTGSASDQRRGRRCSDHVSRRTNWVQAITRTRGKAGPLAAVPHVSLAACRPGGMEAGPSLRRSVPVRRFRVSVPWPWVAGPRCPRGRGCRGTRGGGASR
jgi:hypothetical protein